MYSLEIHGSECVNPLRFPTPNPAQDSQVMGLRIIQLKKPVPIEEIDLSQFRIPDQLPKGLNSYLANPPSGPRPPESFEGARLKDLQPFSVPLLKETTHLLIIAISHGWGDYSKRVIPIKSKGKVVLCVDAYNVLLDAETWPCSKPALPEKQ